MKVMVSSQSPKTTPSPRSPASLVSRAVAPPTVQEVLRAPGRPLDQATRAFMEPRFGHDFGQVRLHADSRAEASAQAVGASAYTVGNHIVLGRNQSPASRNLLAHELTHVIQQQGAFKNPGEPLPLDNSRSASEAEAERHSTSLVPRPVEHAFRAPLVQRQSLPGGAGGSDDQGALLMESYRQSITLAGFDSDKATLKPEHLAKLKEYKERMQMLLGRYPDSFISIIGHTDATDTEAHNKTLGQERADAVKLELTSGDNALPAAIVHGGSLGETSLAVETKGREPRNRRAEVIPQLRRFVTLPPPTPSQPWQPGVTGEVEKPPGIQIPPQTDEKPKIPEIKIPEKNGLEEGLRKDPIIKGLPKWVRDKVVDAAKDLDEKVAEKIIDSLPIDDKIKAGVQAVVKGLLQKAKNKKPTIPETPPRQPDFGPAPTFPKMPGEVIIPGPKIPLPF